jgi:hypothetical protein
VSKRKKQRADTAPFVAVKNIELIDPSKAVVFRRGENGNDASIGLSHVNATARNQEFGYPAADFRGRVRGRCKGKEGAA